MEKNELGTIPLAIGRDQNKDYHIGVPFHDIKPPDGLIVDPINPCCYIKLSDVKLAMEAFAQGKREEVNRILGLYF